MLALYGHLDQLTQAARLADTSVNPQLLLEVEVENFSELHDALAVGADRIMLDEFSLADVRRAVTEVAGRVPLEVSGGLGLDDLPALAATGVAYVSIGALTKHVRAIDLSMRIMFNA